VARQGSEHRPDASKANHSDEQVLSRPVTPPDSPTKMGRNTHCLRRCSPPPTWPMAPYRPFIHLVPPSWATPLTRIRSPAVSHGITVDFATRSRLLHRDPQGPPSHVPSAARPFVRRAHAQPPTNSSEVFGWMGPCLRQHTSPQDTFRHRGDPRARLLAACSANHDDPL